MTLAAASAYASVLVLLLCNCAGTLTADEEPVTVLAPLDHSRWRVQNKPARNIRSNADGDVHDEAYWDLQATIHRCGGLL